MEKQPTLAARFEQFCARLFERLGEVTFPAPSERGYDFRVNRNQKDTLVEVKLYKSRYVPTPWLWSAAARLQSACDRYNAEAGILAVTSRVTPYTRANIQHQSPRIEVFDGADLGRLAAGDSKLSFELRGLLREALDEVPSEYIPIDQFSSEGSFWGSIESIVLEEQVARQVVAEPSPLGEELSTALHAVPVGRDGFREFEKIGERALRYLFVEDFSFFDPQHIRDDLQRTDIVAKLAPTIDFWKGIARDFRTRYVIFEFKNYSSEITPEQIYSTEKYLFTTALRSVAIVIARNGATDQALHAAKGALRETGKLILVVSLDDLCKMLKAKDNNDDPSDILSDVLDQMLMTITR